MRDVTQMLADIRTDEALEALEALALNFERLSKIDNLRPEDWGNTLHDFQSATGRHGTRARTIPEHVAIARTEIAAWRASRTP